MDIEKFVNEIIRIVLSAGDVCLLVNDIINIISSQLPKPCPNCPLMLIVYCYIIYCRDVKGSTKASIDDDTVCTVHHVVKDVVKNMTFSTSITPYEILLIDQRLFKMLSGNISEANHFFYTFYNVIVECIKENDNANVLMYILERLHWLNMKKIKSIDDFLDHTLGYDRNQSICVFTLVNNSKYSVLEIECYDDIITKIDVNVQNFVLMNLDYPMVSNVIIQAVADPRYTDLIRRRLLEVIFDKDRITKSLLFIDKIFCSEIIQDEVCMVIKKDLNGCVQSSHELLQQSNHLFIAKVIAINNNFFGSSTAANKRIYCFYWSCFDTNYIKKLTSSKKVLSKEQQTLITSRYFNLFTYSPHYYSQSSLFVTYSFLLT
jgi:hypothetical protein